MPAIKCQILLHIAVAAQYSERIKSKSQKHSKKEVKKRDYESIHENKARVNNLHKPQRKNLFSAATVMVAERRQIWNQEAESSSGNRGHIQISSYVICAMTWAHGSPSFVLAIAIFIQRVYSHFTLSYRLWISPDSQRSQQQCHLFTLPPWAICAIWSQLAGVREPGFFRHLVGPFHRGDSSSFFSASRTCHESAAVFRELQSE